MKDFIKEVESLDFSQDTRYGCWKTNLLSDVKQKRCDMSESLYDAIYGGNMFLGDDGADRLYALYFLLGDKDEQICDDVPYERFIKMVLHYSLQGNDTEARKNIRLILNGSCPPADILYVLEKGYGANHPLARFIGGFKPLDEVVGKNDNGKKNKGERFGYKKTQHRDIPPRATLMIKNIKSELVEEGICKKNGTQKKCVFLGDALLYKHLAVMVGEYLFKGKARWDFMEEHFTHPNFGLDSAKHKTKGQIEQLTGGRKTSAEKITKIFVRERHKLTK